MAPRVEILIIDNDRRSVETLSSLFKSKGYNPFGVYTGSKGLELALNDVFDLILLDLSLPDVNSLELMQRIKGLKVSAPVIVIAANDNLDLAIKAIRSGAESIIEKPLNEEIVLHQTGNALSRHRLEQDLRRLRDALSDQFRFIGHSSTIEQFREKLKRIALSASRVLFIGEPGTGKEKAARFVHYSSGRAAGPFCVTNCAQADKNNPAGLHRLEMSLFGFEKGAFVGAEATGKGQFELADGGTLYLDEVSALTADHQAKLLRTIESGAVTRLGSSDEIRVDSRILAASTIDLEGEVKAGRFREDLYFRLSVIPVKMPPLRTYPEDIPLLTRYFLDRAGFIRQQIEKEGIEFLKTFDWPGNLRQLKETIIKAARNAPRNRIDVEDIQAALTEATGASDLRRESFVKEAPADGLFRANLSYRDQMIDLEKRLLSEVLNQCDGNITRAARMLKTDRGNLSKKLKKLDVKAQQK